MLGKEMLIFKIFIILNIFYKHSGADVAVMWYLPVAWVVNSWRDAMGVVGRETEAVVLLKVLIGSHTERERGKEILDDKSPTNEPWHINNQNMKALIENVNGATKLFWGEMTEQFPFQRQLKWGMAKYII